MNTLKKIIYFGFLAMLALALDAAIMCGCRTCYGLPVMTLLALVCVLGFLSGSDQLDVTTDAK